VCDSELNLPCLRQVNGPIVVVLNRRRNVVGRAPHADVVLSDSLVSRFHAVIEQMGRHWTIADLGSRNGSYLNGMRLAGLTRIRAGDEIVIGATRLVLHCDTSPEDVVATDATEAAPPLTPREREVVLALLRPASRTDAFVEAATTAEIATTLGLTTAAVHQHLARLYDKFGIVGAGAWRRTRLANEALRRGAVTFAELRSSDRREVDR
jgi:pSer/pThr/pTyr-binding forkhead associated (FHA) protein